jgi:heme-degrading monooxygenase HmoA
LSPRGRKGHAGGTIYELRHYFPVPGKEAAILNRFKNHTFEIFRKKGFKVINFWIDAKGSGEIWYVLVWESASSMESTWSNLRGDQEWIDVKEASEKDGPIVQKIESTLLKRPGRCCDRDGLIGRFSICPIYSEGLEDVFFTKNPSA